ncbi:hypothetical protein Hsw_1280 [Hymenobacter swuensis DY53]|uniref:Uncharacterized protein n=1 Tax=Hymenobacter swuensis DY53 TaxID=1227739 RepID=W8F544_9BACT|nr:hypothetical protein Hsw_1280 [Hymenobacter swuensis DY53]
MPKIPLISKQHIIKKFHSIYIQIIHGLLHLILRRYYPRKNTLQT